MIAAADILKQGAGAGISKALLLAVLALLQFITICRDYCNE